MARSTPCQHQMLATSVSSETDDQPSCLHNGTALADTGNSGTESLWMPSFENRELAHATQSDGLQALQHLNGRCQACMFFQSQLGCLRGDQCPYCHQDYPLLT